MKKYINVIIILVVILTIYSCIVYAISKGLDSKNNNEPSQNNTTPNNEEPKEETPKVNDIDIILSPKSIISYGNNKWFENKDFDYDYTLFDVYVNNESFGSNYLTYNGDWYIYDANKNFKEYDGNVFAIKSSKPYNLLNFVKSELDENDKNIISAFLGSKSIVFNYEDMFKSKIIYDFDRNGIRETLYLISNAFTENEASYNKSFSIAFIHENNKDEAIYENIGDISSVYLICNPYLQNLINIDNSLYVILGCNYFSDKGTEHHLYKVDNEFTKILKTSINK